MGRRLLELRIVVCVAVATLASANRLHASPAMIRLGYAGCQACHLSPQGRGLLTDYGKGIDDAQSARHGVYDADEDRWRRLFQDVRLLTQLTSESHRSLGTEARGAEAADRTTSAALRLWYRNTTRLSHLFRVSGTVSVDAPERKQEFTTLQPQPSQPQVFVRQALLELTPRKDLYVAIGRDTLPSGVEIADQATYMRARNGQGLTDVPTQAKLFWSHGSFQVAPYVYGPSGLEADGFHTSGAGVIAEKYLVGDHLAAGLALRMARNATFDERLTGVYARFGVGRWGVLTEHDLVRRGERSGEERRFDQYTGFVQLFFYPTDWLVTSLSADRLQVDDPFSDARWYLRPEVSARLSPHITIAASLREQYLWPSQRSTTFVVQLFLKSVN